MNAVQNHILRIGLLLALFAIVATSLVVFTEQATRDKISENERQALLNAINAVVSSEQYDNDILSDTLPIAANKQLGTTQITTAYRARKAGQDSAVILTAIAPNGYNGKITLLIGITTNGELSGLRVISHKETPGLGDKIDVRKADWILQFSGLSLNKPDISRWLVKKDGGDFDQFTGATITPRAVVAATKKALLYFEQHREQLFKPANDGLSS